jgi:hypothetical protein
MMIALWAVFAAFREKNPSHIFLFSGRRRREPKYEKMPHEASSGSQFGQGSAPSVKTAPVLASQQRYQPTGRFWGFS